MAQLSHPYMNTGKTIALTRQASVGSVMSWLFFFLESHTQWVYLFIYLFKFLNIYLFWLCWVFFFNLLILLEVNYFTILYWFCHTSTWIHHGCTHVPPSWIPLPPPSPYHPSGSSQCTSPKHPVSCIKPGLAIHFRYDIIHVSMPFSQSSHPLPLPQSPKDCSIHLCLCCCLAYRVIVTIFINFSDLFLMKHWQYFFPSNLWFFYTKLKLL